MQESFLHYIWQFQYFDKRDLRTTRLESLQILQPGLLNVHDGPDFSNARIRIDGMFWAGTVEIHIKSSEWNAHHHHTDEKYDNVVLHVVWIDDKPVRREDGSLIPTLVLKNRIDRSLILQYRKLMLSGYVIPCAKSFAKVPDAIRFSMMDRALAERLEVKSGILRELWRQNNCDWEETAFQVLARNFGFKVNSEPFFQLAKSISYRILMRHADHPLQVEALLFGQAGFLTKNVGDAYHKSLQKEYKLLAVKYKLHNSKLSSAQWKFMRLRPANFPTLRLAQFCSLVVNQKNIFSKILEAYDYQSTFFLFDISQSDYWKSHYRFGATIKSGTDDLGAASIQNIIINTVAPLLTAYGKERGEHRFVDKAVNMLMTVPAEDNRILRSWQELGLDVKNAFDSQALIQLFNSYCMARHCLNCKIGASLLKPDT